MLRRFTEALKRLLDAGPCPYQISFVLSNPLRRLVLSPEELVERLALVVALHTAQRRRRRSAATVI
jgi:hypothetical protein